MKYLLLVLLFILLVAVDVVMTIYHPANRTDLTMRNILLVFFYGVLNAAIVLAGKEVLEPIKDKCCSRNKNRK